MGHGAPVKHSSIPINYIVGIYAAEGLLHDAEKRLGETLKAIFDGSESPEDWSDLNTYREKVWQYSQQYTRAIMSLSRSQNRG